jgi:hypothetical protein
MIPKPRDSDGDPKKSLFDSVGEHSKDCEAGLQGPVECLEEIMQA